jgi:CAAX prenyl protease-like protein
MSKGTGYGWAPYWFPMLAFLLVVEIGSRAPEQAAPFMLPLRVLLPGGLFLWYAARGLYPELRGYRPTAGGLALDVAVGLVGAVLWVVPFLLVEEMRPEAPGFDREQLGASWVGVALTLRAVGYAGVTPFVEELFVRSWLIRFIDVFDRRGDFREIPIARFSWRSFLVVTVYFVMSHAPWEWGVMLVWTLLTMAWFYHRRHIVPIIVAHATTNGAILLFVVLSDGRIRDAAGQPIDLWFLL